MKYLFVLFLLILSACGQEKNPSSPNIPQSLSYEVPEDVDLIVKLFIQEALDRGINLSSNNLNVHFKSNLGFSGSITYYGLCKKENGVPTIILDSFFWNYTASPILKEMLIFHELGHCWLHRGHENSKLSLMDATVIGEVNSYNYLNFRKEVLDELFNE